MTNNPNTRLHFPLLQGLKFALKDIFFDKTKSDRAVKNIFKENPKWGSRDRNFIASNAFEITRNKRLILHTLNLDSLTSEEEIEDMIRAWLIIKGYNNEPFINVLDTETILKRSKTQDPRLKYSIPDELYDLAEKQLGKERWLKELKSMDTPAEVFLRINLSKVSKEEVIKSLQKDKIEVAEIPKATSALKLKKRADISTTFAFKQGWIEVQDAGSQEVVLFLKPEPNKIIIDACAGAGGKTLQIADLTGDNAKIIAMDKEMDKLKELTKRAKRNRFLSIEVRPVNQKSLSTLTQKADYLLLDVPCTGSGVLKRDPDLKDRLDQKYLNNILVKQAKILSGYSKTLKTGGKMVYATCSIFPEENHKQVENFLKNNPEFQLIKEKQIWPSETGFDGFYMALIEKL